MVRASRKKKNGECLTSGRLVVLEGRERIDPLMDRQKTRLRTKPEATSAIKKRFQRVPQKRNPARKILRSRGSGNLCEEVSEKSRRGWEEKIGNDSSGEKGGPVRHARPLSGGFVGEGGREGKRRSRERSNLFEHESHAEEKEGES